MERVMPTIVVESGSPSDSVASKYAEKEAHCNGELLGPAAALSTEHGDTGEDSDSEEVSPNWFNADPSKAYKYEPHPILKSFCTQ